MKIYFETVIDKNVESIKKNFTQDLFLALSPPGLRIKLEQFDGCKTGDIVHLKIQSFGLTQTWMSRITEESNSDNQWFFVDEGVQLPWPLKSWKHVHRVKKINENQSAIIDDITFSSGHHILDIPLKPFLWLTFAVRPSRYRKFFEDK